MSAQIQQFGTQLALDFRDISDSPLIPAAPAPLATGSTTTPPANMPPSSWPQSSPILTTQLSGNCSVPPSSSVITPSGKKADPQKPPASPGPMVGDLLTALRRLKKPPAGLANMHSAVAHACHYLGVAPEQCPVSKLRRIDSGFKATCVSANIPKIRPRHTKPMSGCFLLR